VSVGAVVLVVVDVDEGGDEFVVSFTYYDVVMCRLCLFL